MAELGRGLIFLALAVAVYGIAAALYGARAGRPEWVTSARRSVYALALLTTGAFAVLEVAFLRSDFSFHVVQSHSSTTTPTFYRAAAAWSSQEGSLLLWLWLLSMWSALVLFLTRRRMRDVQPYAVAVLMGFAAFFGGLLVFAASPFDTFPVAPVQGTGLNPLLRHPSMMIHPPMLYSGYTLWAIPFAFAIGALVVRRVDAEWIVATRRFALGAWFFLGVGILLGARWSYAELGWGGYWAWDPVENASLLPWLTGTAFLHSIMVQEKRGMLKTWNASLILATGTLAILGTFLVRSGVLDSIHAFGASTLGVPFVTLIGLMIAGSAVLVVSRRDVLRSEHKLDSLLSREAIFLANNLVLVGLAFVVFWGTFFPLISEAMGRKQALGPPWYDQYTVPLALLLVLLSGIGPVIAWRRATPSNARRNFRWPMLVALATLVVLLPLGVAGRPLALTMFVVASFAIGTVVQEFVRGTRARRAMTGESPPVALVTLVRRNRRRYGGYVVHLGMAVLFIGVAASSAFQHVNVVQLAQGQKTDIGNGYSVTYLGPTSRIDLDGGGVERLVFGARLKLEKGGKVVDTLKPERGYYPIEGAPFAGALGRYFEGESTSEVAMKAGLRRDIWTAVTPDISGVLKKVKEGDAVFRNAQGKIGDDEYRTALGQAIVGLVDNYRASAPPPSFRFIVSPMVAWVWLGGLIVIGGGLICLWPAPDLAPAARDRGLRGSRGARARSRLGVSRWTSSPSSPSSWPPSWSAPSSQRRCGPPRAGGGRRRGGDPRPRGRQGRALPRDPRGRDGLPDRQALRGRLEDHRPRAARRGHGGAPPARRARRRLPAAGDPAAGRRGAGRDRGRRGAAQRVAPRSLYHFRAMLETVLSVVQVFICVILIFLVLMHSGKDSGLSGAFGVGTGAGPLGGGSLVERNLNRWTILFGILLAVNTIILLKVA